MNIDEAIAHAEEKAKELRAKADEDYYFDGDWGKRVDCLECANEHEQLVEWLRELKARREADRWIPVSERLPDTDGYYLVSLGDGQIMVAHSSGIIENHDFEPKILAWKPLPEPYKENDK